ncbi:MAG: excisionase family DNA-binding protein, partial [Limisphaerales bacterium]
ALGEVVRQKLAADEGGSISTAQAARLVGVSKTTVLRRWSNHRLVAWKHGRAVRVPVWQFAGHKMLNGIEETLQIFVSNDQWRVMRYFLGKRLSLRDRSPLDLLRVGKVAAVIAHAKAYAADNTW